MLPDDTMNKSPAIVNGNTEQQQQQPQQHQHFQRPPLLPGSMSSFALIHSRTSGRPTDDIEDSTPTVLHNSMLNHETTPSSQVHTNGHGLLKTLSQMLNMSSSTPTTVPAYSSTATANNHNQPLSCQKEAQDHSQSQSHIDHCQDYSSHSIPIPTTIGKSVIKEDDLFSDNGLEESEEDYYDLIINKYTSSLDPSSTTTTATTTPSSFPSLMRLVQTGCHWTSLFSLTFTNETLHHEFERYIFRAYETGRYLIEHDIHSTKKRGNVKRSLLFCWLLIVLLVLIPQSIMQSIYDFGVITDIKAINREDGCTQTIRWVVSIVVLCSVFTMFLTSLMLYWPHYYLPRFVAFHKHWSNLICVRHANGNSAIWPMNAPPSNQTTNNVHYRYRVNSTATEVDIEQPTNSTSTFFRSHQEEKSQSYSAKNHSNTVSETLHPFPTSPSLNHDDNTNRIKPTLLSKTESKNKSFSYSLSHLPLFASTLSSSSLLPNNLQNNRHGHHHHHHSSISHYLRIIETCFIFSIYVFFICMFLRVSLSFNTYISFPNISSKSSSMSFKVFQGFHSVIVDIFGGLGSISNSSNVSTMSFHRLHAMSTNMALLMMFFLPSILYRLTPHISYSFISTIFLLSLFVFIIVCVSQSALYYSLLAGCVYAVVAWLLIREERISILTEFLVKRDTHRKLLHQCKNVEDACDNEMRHLIANVAHDLKTPLTSFMTGIDYIQFSIDEFQISNPTWLSSLLQHANTTSSFTTKPFKELLESIQSCITNIQNTNMFMLMIINRCIDYSKVSKGIKLLPRNETVDLIETVLLPLTCMQNIQNKITITLLPLGSRSGNNMREKKRLESLPKICSHIITDRLWLQENLLNLLSNAIKYSSSGETTVSISLECEDEADSLVHENTNENTQEEEEENKVNLKAATKDHESLKSNESIPEQKHEQVGTNGGINISASSSGSIRYQPLPKEHSKAKLVVKTPSGISPHANEDIATGEENEGKQPSSKIVHDFTKYAAPVVKSLDSASTLKEHKHVISAKVPKEAHQVSHPPPPTGLNRQHSNMAQLARSLSKQHGLINGESMKLQQHSQKLPFQSLNGLPTIEQSDSQSERQWFLRFEIEDSGVGMSDHAMKNLFNPFQQTQRFTGGTGLGLFSLSKRVEALGGKYGVSHRRDGKQGSLFWFTIPYRPDEVYADVVAHISEAVCHGDQVAASALKVGSLSRQHSSTTTKQNQHHSFSLMSVNSSTVENTTGDVAAASSHPSSRNSSLKGSTQHSLLLSSFTKEEQNEVFQAIRSAVRNTSTKVSFATTMRQSMSPPLQLNSSSNVMPRSSIIFTPTSTTTAVTSTGTIIGSTLKPSSPKHFASKPTEETSTLRPFLGSHSGDNGDGTSSTTNQDEHRELGTFNVSKGKESNRLTRQACSSIEEVVTPAPSAKATPVIVEKKNLSIKEQSVTSNITSPHNESKIDLETQKPFESTVAQSFNKVNQSVNTAAPTIKESEVPEKQNTTIQKQVPPHRKASLPNLKVLVVDDSPAILKMCSMMIKKLGHQTSSAENGEIAVQMCIKEREKGIESNPDGEGGGFDVILMDLQMPVLDGLEAAKRIRSLPVVSTKKEFIIGFSANSDIETQEAALSAGMDIFMPKPFNVANFISAIAHINN